MKDITMGTEFNQMGRRPNPPCTALVFPSFKTASSNPKDEHP
jgi:hypothetical protein